MEISQNFWGEALGDTNVFILCRFVSIPAPGFRISRNLQNFSKNLGGEASGARMCPFVSILYRFVPIPAPGVDFPDIF